MLAEVTQTLSDELKTRPITLLTLLCLLAYSVYTYTHHALAEDVEEAKRQLSEDQTRIEDKLDKLLIINIRSAIQDLRAEFCNTTDSSLRSIMQRSINELAESYRDITGQPYRFESCSDLMARNGNG